MKNEYEIRGEVTAIYIYGLGERMETIISTSDFDKVNSFPRTWRAEFSKKTKSYYVTGRLGDVRTSLHRWIFNLPDKLVIDHINHDTLNNTRKNLRVVTIAENNQNRRVNKSGVNNVHWDIRRNKWRATIKINKKTKHIGYFTDIKEAEKAVIEVRNKFSLPILPKQQK
jgi:hypothetical protein